MSVLDNALLAMDCGPGRKLPAGHGGESMNRGTRMAAGLVLAAAAAGGLSATASAAPRAADAVLTMHAGGDRTSSANTVTGGTVAGTAGVAFTVTNASGTEVGSCTTAAGGTCDVSVTNGQTYTVTESAAPAGWFLSPYLGVGTSTTLAAQDYAKVSVNVPASATAISVPPPGSSSNSNNTYRSGVWAASRDNPAAPAACGLNVALLFDLSGSIAPNLAQFKAAGVNFVRALQGTPSSVALYTFSSTAPANTTNNANVPLTSVSTAALAAPLISRINGFTATGGTNWDRGIWQIAADTPHYDITLVLTDGDPTYFGTGPTGSGSNTRFAEIENGIFAANALKLKGTRVIVIGIGSFTRALGSVNNLKAISGPNLNSDFFLTSFGDLGSVLQDLALHNCAGITIKKTAAPATYDHVGQRIRYTYTVTNTGSFFTLHNVTVTDDHISAPIRCLLTTLAPGESTTCTAVYTITQADLDAGHVTNTAAATGLTPNDDAVPSGPDVATVDAVERPAISIVKTASVHSFGEAGLLITYFFRVTNTGNVTLTPSVTDSTGAGVICPQLELAPGTSMTCRSFHVTTAADVAAGHADDTGFATGRAPDGDAVRAKDPLDIPEVHGPAIGIIKIPGVFSFAAAGMPVTYFYLVTNSGDVTLDPVTVTDSRGLPVSCPRISLAPGELMTCTARYVTTQADVGRSSIANTGTATGTAPDGAEVTDHSSVDIPAAPAPALSIVKTASPVTFSAAGQLITYSYLVTNNGTVSLHGVTVTDSRGLALSCPSTSLAAGQAMTCTARYRTTQADVSAGPIVNIAAVQGTTPSGDVLGDGSVAFVFPAVFFFPVTG
jgi:uncharacterized repeat protein (TIGR01451 family)